MGMRGNSTGSSSDGLSSLRGGDGLPTHLVEMARHLVRGRADAAIEEMRARYALGRLVHRMRYGVSDRLRARTLGKLGKMFRMKPASLHQLARVTEAIGVEEFERYVTARGPRGFTLTWSHIEELAEVRSPAHRRLHAEAALAESLSVGALRARIRYLTGSD
jgi:hypothetical protein